jgi:hypothetical protein
MSLAVVMADPLFRACEIRSPRGDAEDLASSARVDEAARRAKRASRGTNID